MKFKLAILAGDGIGPEVVDQALKTIKAIAKKYNHEIEYKKALVGACAIDAVGTPYPKETHQICLDSDVVLFGAIGHPKYDNDPTAAVRPEQGLLEMRKKLELYANVRPTFTFPGLIHKSPLKEDRINGTNFVFLRELNSGLYFGQPQGWSEKRDIAFDTCIYKKTEVQRIAKAGFELARTRRKKLTVVDKANVLATGRMWRQTVQEMEADYPDIKVEYEFVDAVAMRLIQYPQGYDVLITTNMFGDILTDEASVITGSMGLMPSASVGVHSALFEPIHGSYPQATGKNIANPVATILSAAMMFEHLGLLKEGAEIRNIVNESLKEGVVTEDLSEGKKPFSTSEVGDWIAERIDAYVI